MNTILIMGGSAFVSSSLAKYFIERGHTVDVATRGIKPINYLGYREHIICDRKSKDLMATVFQSKKYEYIFDISAYTKTDVELLLTSVDTTALKKYVFCSSGSVYKPSNTIIDENFKTGENPNWGQYGLNKKAAEDYIINSSVPYIIFRPTYIYGENNNLYREAYFFERIINRKVIPIPYGNNTKTQFIHIDDLVRCFGSTMYNESTNKIYNLTHPEIITWRDLVNLCGEVIEIKPIIKEIDVSKVHLEARSYFPFRDVTYLLDIKRLISDGLYVPKLTLMLGLKKTYDWYKSERPALKDDRMNNVDQL